MQQLGMRRAKLALVIYVGFLVMLVVAADAGWGRRFWNLVQRIPLGDKAGHFILIGALSFLLNWIMQASEFRVLGFSVLRGSAILMLCAFLEELSQLCFRSRTFDIYDLLADALGIWLFGIWATRRWRASSAKMPILKMEPAAGASQPPVNQTQ